MLFSAGTEDAFPVVWPTMWQAWHPIILKTSRPCAEAPVVCFGRGAARKLMNCANRLTSVLFGSSGNELDTHAEKALVSFGSARSLGLSMSVTPCSTV